jgi:hypothetical protein
MFAACTPRVSGNKLEKGKMQRMLRIARSREDA